jgi:mono/diheme cytochrome c family protein
MAKARRKRHTYTQSQRTTILSTAQKEGLTAAQVQKKFGVTPVTYYSWRKKTGVAASRGRRSGGARVGLRAGDLGSQERSRMKWFATVLRVVLALVGILVLLLAALLVHGYGLLNRPVKNPVPSLAVAPDTSLTPRGNHLIRIACASCHGEEAGGVLTMSGSVVNFLDIPGGPKLGVLYAPNITPGGVIRDASDGQLSRAIREGIGFDGKPLLVMPSPHYHAMSDRDLAALIAALRAEPADVRTTPRRRPNALAYLILGLHLFENSAELPVPGPIVAPEEAPDSAYGAYLTPILGCGDCHGADYRGGRKGQLQPVGPDLVASAAQRPLATFELALRHGARPAGGMLDPTQMAWPDYANLTDLEVEAVYAFLRGRPAH